ncbi:hypothetical protein C8Q73DRAFT_482400 [Cubamyces lactineus]|nr:hypothetical protein C8Q73DRAFT_482400 [Cubamyces lactineus]
MSESICANSLSHTFKYRGTQAPISEQSFARSVLCTYSAYRAVRVVQGPPSPCSPCAFLCIAFRRPPRAHLVSSLPHPSFPAQAQRTSPSRTPEPHLHPRVRRWSPSLVAPQAEPASRVFSPWIADSPPLDRSVQGAQYGIVDNPQRRYFQHTSSRTA